jgi:hypothetical protein
MATTENKETKHELDKPLATLKTLRDEIKVRIHLAGMEARETWSQLDSEADKLARKAEQASRRALDEVIGKLQELRRSLEKH